MEPTHQQQPDLRGKGVLAAAATAGAHFKVSSIIHGDLEELSACPEPPRSHTLQDGSVPAPLSVPHGDIGVLL